ncbi:MAG: choline dehydrogenase-like flavoprotein, partial [Myxococcota bacterium]
MTPSDAIIVGRDQHEDLSLDADVVIIGSGAGGSVVAATLAEAGKRVLILEEGPFVAPEVYAKMRPSQSMRTVWRDNAMSFALPIGDTPLINVTMGRAVGGSSILTGGVCFRTPDDVLDVWSEDMGLDELTPAGLEPYFEEVERDIHVETVPESMRSRSTNLFGEGLKTRGVELKPLQRNTRDCHGSGTCNFGCPRQAKLSVDVSYLPRAFAKQARLVSDCLVERIVMEGSRAVGVRGRLLDAKGRRGHNVTIRAGTVVVAAGGWHSPSLLRDIGTRSEDLGRNLTLHPSFRMLARFDEEVNGWSGSLQSAFSDAYMKEGITLVSLFIPTGVLAATMPG